MKPQFEVGTKVSYHPEYLSQQRKFHILDAGIGTITSIKRLPETTPFDIAWVRWDWDFDAYDLQPVLTTKLVDVGGHS